MASPKVGTPVDSVKTVKTVKSVKNVKTVRRAGLARQDLDRGISGLCAPGIAIGYLIPTSCGPITSWRIVGKKKALGLPGLLSGRRDLNSRRSPWQGAQRPRDFNGLADLEGARRREKH